MANISAQFGILNSFDHNTHTWKTYKGRIGQYFVANNFNESTDPEGKRRKAILLSALTEGTYKLATDLTLPKEIDDVPYEDLLNLLDTHFTPKSVGFGERHNFYAAAQQVGETHSQWAARLRGLTAKCGFLNVEEALRDKFIMGMLPGREKEELYAKDLAGLTLAKVVETAENHVRARSAAAASSAAGGAGLASASHDQLFKISNNGNRGSVGKVKCSVCGFTNHKSSECKFANYICKKCHVKGHLRKMCSKVNYVKVDCGGQGEDDESDDGELYYIRSFRGAPMVETVLIKNRPFQFEIDSGSTVTVVSEVLYKTHFKDVPLSNTMKQLMTYNGKKIECVGIFRLPISYAGQTHVIVFYVIRDGGPPLLGRDFISAFNLQLVPVNFCVDSVPPVELLQQQYSELFSDKLGTFNKYKIKLLLKDNAKPVFCKARPVAFALRDKVNHEIDRLVRLGIIEPVEHSEYASPIVPVLKKNGSVRLCADYSRTINKQLQVEKYPLPTTSELFSKIHGGQHFSKLDLSMAYNQFVLDNESKNLTCINTNRGLYTFSRLVFGLASAPSIFQRAIEGVLSGLDGVLCLLDDILVTGKDWKEHLERLNAVLKRLQDAGLTLQKEKCRFFQDKVHYLGYIITKDGLKKAPEKIKAMVEAPVPKNVSELQSFLGLINYYRNFVRNASAILSPLYELLKKGCKWDWNEVHDTAFREIKKVMTSEQVLTHFDSSATIILTVDASPKGLGAILSQIGKDGVERPLSFMSRTLNAAERRYAQIQKEATAIIYGVRRFHQYLYGRSEPFILRTDHKPLLSIFGPHKGIPEMSANRLQRYALFLSSYNYKIEYVRSADNSADYLSRASLPREVHECACTEQCKCCDCEVAYDRATYVCFVVDGSMPVTLHRLREETKSDIVLRLVINCIMKGWPPKVDDIRLKPYHLCRSQLSYENGCVMRGHKVVIPASLHQTMLKELHSSHLGIVKTKGEARSRFWFPGIDQAVETMIGTCDVCIQLRPSPPRAPLTPWEYPARSFDRIHIDFLGPIKGCVYLVAVDAHTKWVEVYNMKTSTSSAAVILKLCEFMSRFGVPKTIVSDNGTAFCSREFELFCSTNGISHMTSPVYHPSSNGQAESFVKIVKRGIKSCLLWDLNAGDTWTKLLKYLMDYRNSVNTTTGLSPAQLVFGHKLRSRLDLIDPNSSAPSPPPSPDIINNQQCTRNKEGKTRVKKLKKNDIVLYKKFINKTKYTWCKGIVQKKLGNVLYLVKDIDSSEMYKRHINQLMLYKGTSNNYWDSVHSSNVNLPVASPPPPLPPPQSPPPPPPPPSSPLSSLTPLSSSEPLSLSPESPEPQVELPSPNIASQSASGRRAELYVPSDSPWSGEDEYASGTLQRDDEMLADSVCATARQSNSDDEFYEAEAEVDTRDKPQGPGVVPKRLLRPRPIVSYKKYF
ncbi:uncharacterized protein K02A2.6-like [Hyposmocoma kahamanoa]|uniref:uncharacterized protein K02A2.6-like n=1 Tax=Hyposmocoma kahamanoa TaxID=1477025 RepID=UPI000E6D6F94|nr:uncharacterized protein K02A2.6-like [Hyposmocoma kahamanoa]